MNTRSSTHGPSNGAPLGPPPDNTKSAMHLKPWERLRNKMKTHSPRSVRIIQRSLGSTAKQVLETTMAYVVDSNKGSQPWGYSTLDDFGDVITGKTDQSNWYSGKEEEAGGEAESALGNDATTREDAIAAATTLQEFVAWGRVLFAARWPGLAHTVDILKRTIDGSRRSEPPPHAIWTALPPRPAAAAAAASSSFWPPFDKTDPDPAVRLLARLAEPKRYALVDPWKRGTAAHMLGVVRDVEAYAHPTSKELIGGLDELEVVAAVVLLAGRSAEDDASALRRKLDRLLAVTGVG